MNITNKQITEIKKIVKTGYFKLAEPLHKHTTIKIGGKASVYIETISEAEVKSIYQYCKTRVIPFYVLGGGSNVIFAQAIFPGVVLKMIGKAYKLEKKLDDFLLTFPAGYSMHLATQKALQHSLSGFEYLHGLPGTIGGAVYMNSKWPKNQYQISQSLVSVRYLTEDCKIVNIPKFDLKFDYGYSSFQDRKGIILSVTFRLRLDKPAIIRQRHKAVMAYRKQTQPIGVFTAGCIFKNIDEDVAAQKSLPCNSIGYLIDQCQLKGFRVGDLMVSSRHANFVINTAQASYADYKKLVKIIKNKVKAKYGFDLKEEVEIVKQAV